MVVTGSIDKTCKLWDLRNPSESLKTFAFHKDEAMDVCFNLGGTKLLQVQVIALLRYMTLKL